MKVTFTGIEKFSIKNMEGVSYNSSFFVNNEKGKNDLDTFNKLLGYDYKREPVYFSIQRYSNGEIKYYIDDKMIDLDKSGLKALEAMTDVFKRVLDTPIASDDIEKMLTKIESKKNLQRCIDIITNSVKQHLG